MPKRKPSLQSMLAIVDSQGILILGDLDGLSGYHQSPVAKRGPTSESPPIHRRIRTLFVTVGGLAVVAAVLWSPWQAVRSELHPKQSHDTWVAPTLLMTALFAFTAILILVVSRFYFGRTVRELGKAGRQATRVAVVTTGLGLLFALVLAVVHITGITVGSSAPPTTSAQTTGAQTTAVPTTSPRPGPVVTKTSVPSLVGMTEGEMTAALLQRRLVVAPFFVAVSNVPAGLVATQYPAANTRVPVHSVVTVDLSEANVIPVTG